MKKRWTAAILCFALLLGFSGCKSTPIQKTKEESGGTGFGVINKSVLTMQDLYFLRPGSNRSTVNEKLGSPLSLALEETTDDTYRLTDGETLVLTYNLNQKVIKAELTDTAGKKKDFFAYLNELGIISNYKPEGGGSTVPSVSEQDPEEPSEPVVQPDEQEVPSVEPLPAQKPQDGYFSSKRYNYEMAAEILKEGAERETVVSAFGKPNSFSSVNFEKDSYIIDVYTMEDGSVLYLDYGYNRTALRAVRRVSGSQVSAYLGAWGQEAKPEGYVRFTRNQEVFNNLKRNTKPSDIYRRFGAPDWLEGSASRYRDAYMLRDGAVFYMDFGPNHTGLTAVVLQRSDGSVVNYTLRG